MRQNPVPQDWLLSRKRSGSSTGYGFPTAPFDGQKHYPPNTGGEDKEWFVYNDEKSKWLSENRYTFQALGTTQSATNPLWIDYASASLIQYSASVGHPTPYAFELMTLSLCAIVSSTCTVQLYVNGSAHSGSTISLAAASQNQADGYTSATIAKGSILGFWVTSGTLTGGGVLTATFARTAT